VTSPSPTIAQMFNTIVQGWINYYGRFYKSTLYPLLRRINEHLVALGLPEVQTAAPARKTSEGIPGPRRKTLPGLVRSLAPRPQT